MITFQCQCGKSLRVKDEAAGKRVRCPACSQVVAVPQATEAVKEVNLGATIEEAERQAAGPSGLCPQCHVELPAGAVLCTTCGFDLRTGKKIVGRRTLLERIPWGTIRSVGSAVLLLAILAVVAYFLMGALSRPSAPANPTKGGAEKGRGAQGAAAPARRAAPPAATFVRVRCVAKGPEPALAEGFVFHGADREDPAKKLTDLLVARLIREASDTLLLAGYQVLHKGDPKPRAEEELTLEVDADLAWTYQAKEDRREPSGACVTACAARLLRANGVPFWESKERATIERPDTQASPEDVARVGALKGARTDVDYGKSADQVASDAVGRALLDVPDTAAVATNLRQEREAEEAARQVLADFDGGKGDMAKAARLVAGGNPYAIAGLGKRVEKIKDPAVLAGLAARAPDREVQNRAAQLYVKSVGTGSKATEAIEAMGEAEKLLLGPLRAPFTQPSASLAAELLMLGATAKRMPYLALVYARIGARIEQDASVKQAFRGMCLQLEAKTKSTPIPVEEISVLREVAEAEPTNALGRMAMTTLLETKGFMAEVPAFLYLCKVAANCVPDVAEPWPDGSLRLSDDQMAMVHGVAARDAKLAETAAIALLMRVGGEQREEIRKVVKCLPPFDDPVLGPILSDLQSDDTTKVCNIITHGIPHGADASSLAPLMAEAYYKNDDPTTRATALYGLFLWGKQTEPYRWALLKMLDSSDPVERRASAAALARLGAKTAPFIRELHAVARRQTDPQTRRSLDSAVSQAATMIRQMVILRDQFMK